MPIRRFDIDPILPLLDRGFTVLAPNNRSVDGILREYASHTAQQGNSILAWPRPDVFAIDIYIQQLWQLAASRGIAPFNETLLLTRFDEKELWLQIVNATQDEHPLLNSDETANSAARSYQFFKQWHVADSDALSRYGNAFDFQTFLQWSRKFEARCRAGRIASLSDAGSILAAHIDSLKKLLPQKIALINFNQPPPLYVELFQALSTVCELEWDSEFAPEKNLAEAFSIGATQKQKFSGLSEEIDACLAWAGEKQQSSTQCHIGIVVDHARTLDSVIEESLFKQSDLGSSEKFDLSIHLNRLRSLEKLNEQPDFDAALGILALNNELIDSERFCRILQSPHTTGYDEERFARIAFETYFRRKAEAEIRLSHLRELMMHSRRDHYCPILSATLLEFSELARREPSHQSLRQWLRLFERQLNTLGWLQEDPTQAQQKAAQRWQQCVQRLASSSSVLGNISLTAALAKLKTFLSQSNADLNFDDRLQITLVDIEEAQDLVFDHVWVLAADDRSWPPPINPVPFLPYSLQQELGMPATTHQQQLESSIQQLSTLRRQTRADMVISFHALEEELHIRPSALLNDIADSAARVELTAPAAQLANKQTLERIEESLMIPLSPSETISGGTSLLSNQSNCPFRAFAKNRLGASALETFKHGLTPLLRGNALHKALENVGAQIKDSTVLKSLSAQDRDRVVADSAELAIAYLRLQNPETMTPSFAALEHSRLSQLLQGFLQIELERNDFQILHNEKSLSWDYSKLSLNLRIDRIDQLQDGSLALIDYKTGKYTDYKWFDERPDDMQMPLYQLAVSDSLEQTVAATLICQLNAENIGVVSPMPAPNFGADIKVSSNAKSIEGGWQELQGIWNSILVGLVSEFESGLVAVAPTRGKNTCKYCDLEALCRVAETLGIDTAEEDTL